MQKERKRFTSKTYDNMKDEQTTCTPCEQNFENKVNELVDQVEDYTKKDHMQKEREVEDAFASDGEAKH